LKVEATNLRAERCYLNGREVTRSWREGDDRTRLLSMACSLEYL